MDSVEHKDELLKVVIVLRHGARGPSLGALAPFQSKEKHILNPVVSQWEHNEVEMLSPVGISQMEKVGEWFAHKYCLKNPKIPPEKSIPLQKWRSSKVDRVIASGDHFWKGFESMFGTRPKDPMKYETEDPDEYFRMWAIDKEYLKKVQEIKQGPAFDGKGNQELPFLDRILSRFNIDTSKNPAEKLSMMTYFKELMDCEKFYPFKRDELSSKLSKEEMKKIDELSHWVWEQRFFVPHFGPRIGGKLLKEIVHDLAVGEHFVSVYSAHDYSLLAILSALGKDHYPGNILSFGAFLLWELYEDFVTKKKYVKIRLNSKSFEEIQNDCHHTGNEIHFHPFDLDVSFAASKKITVEELQQWVATFKLKDESFRCNHAHGRDEEEKYTTT